MSDGESVKTRGNAPNESDRITAPFFACIAMAELPTDALRARDAFLESRSSPGVCRWSPKRTSKGEEFGWRSRDHRRWPQNRHRLRWSRDAGCLQLNFSRPLHNFAYNLYTSQEMHWGSGSWCGGTRSGRWQRPSTRNSPAQVVLGPDGALLDPLANLRRNEILDYQESARTIIKMEQIKGKHVTQFGNLYK